MSNSRIIALISFLVATICVNAQNNDLSNACRVIKESLYGRPFDYDEIVLNLSDYDRILRSSSRIEFDNCNCADTLWKFRYTHQYRFIKESHPSGIDAVQYLNSISHEIDKLNLAREFKFQEFENSVDSFHFVLDRLLIKYGRKKFIYNLITAEVDFLKRNKYGLFKNYLKVVDDISTDQNLTDDIFLALFNSNQIVADSIKNRIVKKQFEQHFFRMFGVIKTSSSNRFPNDHLEILENLEYIADSKKIEYLLGHIYDYSNSNKLRRKYKRRLKKILLKEQFTGFEIVDKVKEII